MTDRIGRSEDGLGQLLESLRPSAAIFCRAEVRAPWGFRIEGRDSATFHILTQGKALLEVEGVDEPISLEDGTLVLLPTGAGHALRDSFPTPVPRLEAAVGSGTVDGKWVSFGGGGATAVMVCGACNLGVPGTRPRAAALPPVVTHRLDPAFVRVVAREAEGLASGTEAVLRQLLALVVLQALRSHLAQRSTAEVEALLCPEIARAVSYIHDNLEREIRLADLCAFTATSRSVLTARFHHALGVSPIEYQRMARLSRAAEMLRTTRSGLERIARSVGYRSASTFTRAFRREYGAAPGEFRNSG
jgi:AraC-like DNA-binding protein